MSNNTDWSSFQSYTILHLAYLGIVSTLDVIDFYCIVTDVKRSESIFKAMTAFQMYSCIFIIPILFLISIICLSTNVIFMRFSA